MTPTALKKLAGVAGRHHVDDGLYLYVRESGNPMWIHRYVAPNGNRRDMSLGPFPSVGQLAARELVARWRRERANGHDPIAMRDAERETAIDGSAPSKTLREAAQEYHSAHKSEWRNDKHAAQWLSSLEHLGKLLDRPLAGIKSKELLGVLEPLNAKRHETAKRLRQRLEAIYDRAMVADIVTANPAAALKRELRASGSKRHHGSLPYSEIPAFIRRLRDSDAGQTTRLAFEWLILSASRTSEVRFATWPEIDKARKVWTVPGERMKSGQKHEVPVTDRMRVILGAIECQRGESWDWIFPGAQARRNPLSDGVFLAVLDRMGLNRVVTAHGMRSSYSTWAHETQPFRSEVIEASLSHREADAVKAAYSRAQYWADRVKLAEAWQAFCLSK